MGRAEGNYGILNENRVIGVPCYQKAVSILVLHIMESAVPEYRVIEGLTVYK